MAIQGQTYQRYQVTLVTKSPLRIGASADPLIDVDAPVALVGGRAVVQGSTLKGAFRARLEELLINDYADSLSDARPCIPADRKNVSPDERALTSAGTGSGKYKGPNCGYIPRPPKNQRGKVHICPACYLLGTMGLIGFVRVPYLFADRDVQPEEGYSIRQDRAIGGAASGSNRRFQLIPPNTPFMGTLEVLLRDDIRGWELGKPRPLRSPTHQDSWLKGKPWSAADVLAKLVEAPLQAVTQVGGFRSKGFGDVEIQLKQIGG